MPPPNTNYTDFQIQVLLERILRRPLWKVRREGPTYLVYTTAHEQPVRVPHFELAESMANGNVRATPALQKTLLAFQNTGIPDKEGNDITGRFTPPTQKPAGFSIFRLFGGKGNGNGSTPPE
ncbi:MAG: hypothetical protein FD180_1824 [Planctomycetota bacterium]|nr:MAG: hypothetical protein FD180_1824 [Planctomycetota bacterium]